MPSFVAQVELRFEAESLDACGRRLHALTQVLRGEGVELKCRLAPCSTPQTGACMNAAHVYRRPEHIWSGSVP
jgi:hypothetical protein